MRRRLLRFLGPVLGLVAAAPHAWDARWPAPLGRRAWLRLRDAALAARPRRFTAIVEPEGITYNGDTRDVIQRAVFLYGVWEPDITAWVRGFLRAGDVVADVGANTGYYALLFGSLVGPDGRVIAFEPVPSIHAELLANLEVNGAHNVEAVRAAVGATAGEIDVFRASEANIGNSSTRWEPGHVAEGRAPVVVGDEALGARASSLRLVKIDTEGDEIQVLRGLGRVLAAMPSGAGVLVEVTPDKLALRGDRGVEVWNLFAGLGWHANRVRNDYDFARYDGDPRSSLHRITELPPERCDLVFLKP